MFIIILACIFAALIYFKIIKPNNYWKEKGIPYIKPWPIVGNMAPNFFRKQALGELLSDMYKTFPDQRYVGIQQYMQPTLLIRDLDLIKRITVKEFDAFPDHRAFFSGDADPLASKNLFNMTSAQGWHSMRVTLSPAFTSSKMKAMFVLMEKCAEQLVNHYQNEGGCTITLDVKDTFMRFANDIIATTAFGVDCDSFEGPDNTFYVMGKDLINVMGLRALKFFGHSISPALTRLFKITLLSKEATEFFKGLVLGTLRVREEKQIIRPDMIHLLMEARKGRLKHETQNQVVDSGFAVSQESTINQTQNRQQVEFTDDDIAAQSFTFFFAGFHTSSNLMSFLFYELAVNPGVQATLHQEIVEACKDEITYEVLLGMKYLDCVISEALRKWPALWTDRKSTKLFTIEPELPGERALHLDVGTIIVIPIFGIHRDPHYYHEPDKFDPERFNDENKRNIKPFSYLPFGAGRRNCMGSRFALLETKLITVKILQKFEVIPVKKTQNPLQLGKGILNTAPSGGIWLGLKPR